MEPGPLYKAATGAKTVAIGVAKAPAVVVGAAVATGVVATGAAVCIVARTATTACSVVNNIGAAVRVTAETVADRSRRRSTNEPPQIRRRTRAPTPDWVLEAREHDYGTHRSNESDGDDGQQPPSFKEEWLERFDALELADEDRNMRAGAAIADRLYNRDLPAEERAQMRGAIVQGLREGVRAREDAIGHLDVWERRRARGRHEQAAMEREVDNWFESSDDEDDDIPPPSTPPIAVAMPIPTDDTSDLPHASMVDAPAVVCSDSWPSPPSCSSSSTTADAAFDPFADDVVGNAFPSPPPAPQVNGNSTVAFDPFV